MPTSGVAGPGTEPEGVTLSVADFPRVGSFLPDSPRRGHHIPTACRARVLEVHSAPANSLTSAQCGIVARFERTAGSAKASAPRHDTVLQPLKGVGPGRRPDDLHRAQSWAV